MQNYERLEIVPDKLRAAVIALALCLPFVVVSIVLVTLHEPAYVFAGVVGLVFFGGGGIATAAVTLLRKGWSIALTRAGIELDRYDGSGIAGLIPWADIEGIGMKTGALGYIGLRLSSYDRFVASLGDGGTRLVRRVAPWMRFVANAGFTTPEYSRAMAGLADASGPGGYIAVLRETTGFDYQFRPNDLDRSIVATAALLTEWWERYRAAPLETQSVPGTPTSSADRS